MNPIIEAARFAHKFHDGQFRKQTGEPYIVHPMRVANAVMLRPDSTEEMVIAAFLHDTIEDCNVTTKDLTLLFGNKVAQLVLELTNRSILLGLKEQGISRKERKRIDHEALFKVSREAKIIKMYDRLDNLCDMDTDDKGWVKKYSKESLDLLDVVRDADTDLASQLDLTIRELL